LETDEDAEEQVFRLSEQTYRKMLLAKEDLIGVRVSGIAGSETTFPMQDDDGDWYLHFRGHGIAMWSNIEALLADFIDVNSIWSDNPMTVLKKLGLEAALSCLEEELNVQMNGNEAAGIKGMGDYDYRYIRTLIDAIGHTGGLIGAAKIAGSHNPSTMAAISFESFRSMLVAGVTMGNKSNFDGVAESVNSGRTVLIGREFHSE
jgi:hypothetical protein